jgi:hypothetical protein
MNDEKTFAYLLTPVSYHDLLANGFPKVSPGDIIEFCMESEDQATNLSLNNLTEWEDIRNRIAPVQLTRNWNTYPYLVSLLKDARIKPIFDNQADSSFEKYLLYFIASDIQENIESIYSQEENKTEDLKRFYNVLSSTIFSAQKTQKGVLFIGDWGWSYDYDQISEDVKLLLHEAGFIFIDRHP